MQPRASTPTPPKVVKFDANWAKAISRPKTKMFYSKANTLRPIPYMILGPGRMTIDKPELEDLYFKRRRKYSNGSLCDMAAKYEGKGISDYSVHQKTLVRILENCDNAHIELRDCPITISRANTKIDHTDPYLSEPKHNNKDRLYIK
jgi:hypothetical protein